MDARIAAACAYHLEQAFQPGGEHRLPAGTPVCLFSAEGASSEAFVAIVPLGLERSEAVLLRHLSEVYKVLSQTVTPGLKTAELIEAERTA